MTVQSGDEGDGDDGGVDHRDLSNDPHACSKCGVHIGAFGDDYCDSCAREIGAKPPLRRCEHCGQRGPEEQMEAVDISEDGEYYPELIYLCRSCSGGDSDG